MTVEELEVLLLELDKVKHARRVSAARAYAAKILVKDRKLSYWNNRYALKEMG